MKRILICIFNIVCMIVVLPLLGVILYTFMAIDFFKDKNSPARKFVRGEIYFLEWMFK